MSNLTPFNQRGNQIERLPRNTGRALETVRGHGIVSAAKVEAAAYVAHIGLQEVGMLSLEEALIANRVPHAAGRAQAIVDQFTAVAASELARMRFS
jgi:hypothetical protein